MLVKRYLVFSRLDNQYLDNDFTIEQLRNDICCEVLKEENKDLHHLLYFGSDLLDQDDWKDLMNQVNEDSLHCDLPFVQLAANYMKREIVLIPIYQPESEKEISINKDDVEETIIKVIPNEKTSNHLFHMLYFPQGEFGPHLYFQSVFKDDESTSHIAWASYTVEELGIILSNEHKKVIKDLEDEDSEDESEEGDNFQTTSKETKKKFTSKKNTKNMKRNTSYTYNDVTMLTPVDPTAKVIVNNTNKTMKKKVNKKDPIYEIAPGEGKIPSNWLREKDNDIDSFPELHVQGKFGFDYERDQVLTRAKYFAQRIMNVDQMYAENHDYVFMAQQACERFAIERNINMAMSHGSKETNEQGESIIIPSDDAYNIFQKVPGTPAYWKAFRNELYAKMEALGPFHVFFTFSCAEMRWASVLLEVLKIKLKRTLKVMYLDHFEKQADNKAATDEDDETVLHQKENVSWNGETSTVLIYDKNMSDGNVQSHCEKVQDPVWKGK